MHSVRHAFKVLNLPTDASLKDVRTAYRTLVRSWHPDRFTHDPQLQQKAQERLKEINAAYNIARKNIVTAESGVDSPFRFPSTHETPDRAAATGPGRSSAGTRSSATDSRQSVRAPSIERPVMLNVMFLLVAVAATWMSWHKYGLSHGVVHLLLIMTIPTICAAISNTSFRTRQVRVGYLAALILAAAVVLFDEVTLQTHVPDVSTTRPADEETVPGGNRFPAASGGYTGDSLLGPSDRAPEVGVRSPSAPLSPSSPLAPTAAPPSPPHAPTRH